MEYTNKELIAMNEEDLPSKYIILNYKTKNIKMNRESISDDQFINELSKLISYLIIKLRKKELAKAKI